MLGIEKEIEDGRSERGEGHKQGKCVYMNVMVERINSGA